MAAKTEQNYANHRRYVPLYHFVLTLLLLISLGSSVTLLYRAWSRGSGRLATGLLFLLVICAIISSFYLRTFALKAQDRAIRAEENLRHYVHHGSLLDPRLTTRQIIGLRFAPDDEFGALARRAAEEGLSEDQIKREVGSWRADHYRV